MNLSRRHLIQSGVLATAAGLLPSSSKSANPKSSSAKKPVRGIIFLVSDGMSAGVLTMADQLSQQTRDRATRWSQLMTAEDAVHGLMETYSSNSLVTDSAAAASAWGGGQRIPNGHINVTDSGRELEPINATLKKAGLRTGLVTTATVTHATPAGFTANTPERNRQDDIAPQYLDRADIILGGGTPFFDPKKRGDQRDLAADFSHAGYDVVRDRDAMLAAKSPKLLGLFADGHLPYTVDHQNSQTLRKSVPTLAEMSRVALDRLLRDDTLFLLQIEGARIDHAAHANDIAGLLWDQIAFDDAIVAAQEAIAGLDDILLIVTSDHGNANPALNGTGARYARTNQHFAEVQKIKASHEHLLSEWRNAQSKSPDVLSKLMKNELQITPTRPEAEVLFDSLQGKEITEWSNQLNNPKGLLGQIVGNHTGTGWTGVSHTADPTVLTALGPQANRFHGLIRNDHIHQHLLDILIG